MAVTTEPAPAEAAAANPFPGPRPFTEDDQAVFFGRSRELEDLLTLVLVERVILFHAPSGTGKTSLVNAGLVPRARADGFDVLPVARVRFPGEAAEADDGRGNRYVRNIVQNWRADPRFGEVTGDTLASCLATLGPSPEPGRLLIFDQFEELFVVHPERWRDREDLVRQVQQALDADPLLRVLIILRDDYLARLERYGRLLRDRFRARYALQGLDRDQAAEASVQPFGVAGIRLQQAAAELLVGKLLAMPLEGVEGTYEREQVEPLQLQIVCSEFFDALLRRGTRPGEVTEQDVAELVDVQQALAGFYDRAIAGAIRGHPTLSERRARLWLERKLITPHHTRSLVLRGDQKTEGLPNDVVDELARRHLFHEEPRGRDRWYELSHDRLVEAILASNRAWLGASNRRRVLWGAVLGGSAVALLGLLLLAGLRVLGDGARDDEVMTEYGSVSEQDPVATYDVDGEAGQLLTAILEPSGRLRAAIRLVGPNGTPIASRDDGAAFPAVSATLTRDGRYRVEVRGLAGSTGSFTLRIVREHISGEPRTVEPDTFTEGSISRTDEVDLYRFRGTRGRVALVTVNASDVDPILTLVTPDGTHFGDDDSGGSGNAATALVLPEDGVYEVRASSVGSNTGPYTLGIAFVAETPLEPSLLGTLDPQRHVNVYTITSESGGVANIALEPGGGGSGVLTLLSASGQRVARSRSASGAYVIAHPIVPAAPYLLIVANDSGIASYKLAYEVRPLRDVSSSGSSGALDASRRVEAFRVPGQAGSVMTISVRPAADLDVNVEVLAPDGTRLEYRNEGGSGKEELFGPTLPVTGTYLIAVSSPESNPSGTFELRLSVAAPRGPS